MKLLGMLIEKSARDKEWGFTEASAPRFTAGGDTGVLICHGFGGTPANMRCLTEAAEELGLTVCAPLLSGHAATLGEMEKHSWLDWRADADAAYEKLVSHGCGRIYLCGLSMGALLMADLAERRCEDSRIEGLFLICPPIKMRGYLNFAAWAMKLPAPYMLTAEGFSDDPDAEMYYGMATRKLGEINALSKAVRGGLDRISAPVQLIEAELDNRVDPRTYEILKKHLADSRHCVFRGAPHGIPYSDSREELARVFSEYLKTGRRIDDQGGCEC